MGQTVWTTNAASRELTAERDGLRAAVSRIGGEGAARFLVLRPVGASARPALVQSGHRRRVWQAMQAAEWASERLAILRWHAGRRAYRPRNTGLRFARNASAAALKSSVSMKPLAARSSSGPMGS